LLFVDVLHEDQVALLHSVSLGYVWSRKRLSLTLKETATFGRQSYLAFGNVGVAAPPNAGASAAPAPAYLPREQVVYYDSFTTAAGVGYALSRRWSTLDSVAYVVSGGIGSSEAFIPRSHGPNGLFTLTFAATRHDTLTTSLSEAYLVVPSLGSRFLTSTLMETWGHALGKRTQTTLAIGVSELHSRANAGAQFTDSLLASSLAGLTHTKPLSHDATLGFSVTVGLATPYNQVIGVVQQQVYEYATSTLHVGHLTTGVYLTSSESLPQSSPNATRLFGAGTQTTYLITKVVTVSAGAAWSTQILPAAAGGDIPSQWSVFAGLGLAAPPIAL
jgi:hypothetical protein